MKISKEQLIKALTKILGEPDRFNNIVVSENNLPDTIEIPEEPEERSTAVVKLSKDRLIEALMRKNPFSLSNSTKGFLIHTEKLPSQIEIEQYTIGSKEETENKLADQLQAEIDKDKIWVSNYVEVDGVAVNVVVNNEKVTLNISGSREYVIDLTPIVEQYSKRLQEDEQPLSDCCGAPITEGVGVGDTIYDMCDMCRKPCNYTTDQPIEPIAEDIEALVRAINTGDELRLKEIKSVINKKLGFLNNNR